jgi:pepF/M3 family oligoendopeptidase
LIDDSLLDTLKIYFVYKNKGGIMALNWNLNRLYDNFESEKFLKDMKEMTQLVNTYNESIKKILSKENPSDIIESYLKLNTELTMKVSGLASFASLSFSTDSKNSKALETIQKIQKLMNNTIEGGILFEKWLVALDDYTSYLNNDFLKAHQFYLSEIIKKEKYSLDEKTEQIVADMRLTGSKAWDTLQKKTASSIKETFELDGEEVTMPLQAIRNLAMEKDADKRKLGYEVEMTAYPKHENASAAALNGIKGESLTLSKLRGYESPLDHTLVSSKMTKKTLDAMLKAMKNAMPKFREYLKAKANYLGHKNGLPFYDIFAPIGSSDITYPYEKGKALVLEQFKTYSDELYEFTKVAFDKDWIDVEPKEGKSGGAFCASVLPLKESRILLNYTGKLNNAVTLAHELGHAFHNHNLFKEEVLNIGSPMPLAETASIFCETIVKNAALKEASSEEKVSILEVALQGYTQVIIDIYSRYLFESSLFEKRQEGPLDVEVIKSLMLEAQEGSYGDGLDPDIRHPYMWMCKTHYYIPAIDFYNFPYAFGLLFAKGLYAKYQELGESFIPRLNMLLSSTGKMDIIDVAKQMGVDVEDTKFWEASLNVIGQEIDEFLSLI